MNNAESTTTTAGFVEFTDLVTEPQEHWIQGNLWINGSGFSVELADGQKISLSWEQWRNLKILIDTVIE